MIMDISEKNTQDKPADRKTIFILDGSSFLYRAFYSLPPMHTVTGRPVQVVYGFCRMIKKIIRQFDPAYFAVAWDSSARDVPNMRRVLYDQYKASRTAAPQDLTDQREPIKEFCRTIGLCQVEHPGIEADDILFSLTRDFVGQGYHVVLITSDKDMQQCIGQDAVLFDPFKDQTIDRAYVEARYGIPLEKLAFYFSLIGDTSDNIPGARGIGPKTAQELVNRFASLEDLYHNIDKIERVRVRELLATSHDAAFLSYKLFLLYYHPCAITPADCAFAADYWFKARAFFEQLNFTSLLKDFPAVPEGEAGAERTAAGTKIDARFVCINRLDDLHALCAEIRAVGSCALDTETSGLDTSRADLVGISVCTQPGTAYYIPVRHKDAAGEHIAEQLELSVVCAVLKPIFDDPAIKKYFHHAVFDMVILSRAGLEISGLAFDTMIAAHLMARDGQSNGLKRLSEFYLGQTMTTYEEVVTKKKLKDFSYVPLESATQYAAADAHQTRVLVDVLTEQLKLNHQEELFLTLEMPLVDVLYKMQREGIAVDRAVFDELDERVMQAIRETEAKIYMLLPAGTATGLNLNSPRQLEDLLFNVLKLTPIKKTTGKTGYSTDQEVLQELAKGGHPVPALLVRYRELYKIKSTYIDALKTYINPETHKIYTSFRQTATATGRLASSDPNLQNIPTGASGEFSVRSAFKAQPDHVFLSADYSQIELRVLAYLSQDQNLLNTFIEGRDIHTQTAAGLFDTPLNDVKPEQRSFAKTINFGILYGLSAYGLARELDIAYPNAKTYIERYFAQYPGVVAWMEKIVEEAKRDGYVQTLWGRRRYVPGIREGNKTVYELARRIAINTVVQGTAAELMKKGMLLIDRLLVDHNFKTKLIIQIHDELLLTVPQGELSAVEPAVRIALERVVDWNVPLTVTVRTGKDWQEATK